MSDQAVRPHGEGLWRVVGKASIYLLVTLLPAILALRIALEMIPGFSQNEKDLPVPRLLFGAPNATSYRQNSLTIGVHSPTNLLDDDPKTTWVECKHARKIVPVNTGSSRIHDTRKQCKLGGSSGDPQSSWSGESVTFPLATPTTLKLISIRNGDEYSVHEYYRSPRAANIEVEGWTCQHNWYSWSPFNWAWTCPHPNSTAANVCWVQHLPDEMGYQTFGPPAHAADPQVNRRTACHGGQRSADLPTDSDLRGVTQIRLTVLDAYLGEDQLNDRDSTTGDDSASTDLAISDVLLIPALLPATG